MELALRLQPSNKRSYVLPAPSSAKGLLEKRRRGRRLEPILLPLRARAFSMVKSRPL